MAIYALGEMGGENVVALLEDIASSGASNIQSSAVYALGNIGSSIVGAAGAGVVYRRPIVPGSGEPVVAPEVFVFDQDSNIVQTNLPTRDQFGVKIGSFQALQHRASIMYAELEMARSVILQALSTVDENPDHLPLIADLELAPLS